jgi:predicted component of type VI protein secretion system
MQKSICLGLGLSLLVGGSALAQLPANPWDTSQFDEAVQASATTSTVQETAGADVGHITSSAETSEAYIPSITYDPVNADATAPVYTPAIAADGTAKTGVAIQGTTTAATKRTVASTGTAATQASSGSSSSWRGSGKFGNLNYTGSVTTYDTAQGQEMLAPEVNTHNMNVMVQHLRDLGYKIPDSYDNKFQNFTQDYASELRKAYNGLGHQNNPFDTMFSGFLDFVEDQTGLDMENLLFNSFDLMSKE